MIRNYWVISSILLILSLSVLNFVHKPAEDEIPELQTKSAIQISDKIDESPRVTGIGGIFFKCDDPAKVRAWYSANLGMAMDDYGAPFEFRNGVSPEEINYLRWAPFDIETDYFEPSSKEFMINYRVQHIEQLTENLKANGVQLLDSIVAYEYGKFVHLLDLEGNKIELWEPADSVLTQMGGPTTK